MESILGYIKESYDEIVNKVTWPSWGSLISTSRVVIIATIVITIIIFLMDGVASQALKFIYPDID